LEFRAGVKSKRGNRKKGEKKATGNTNRREARAAGISQYNFGFWIADFGLNLKSQIGKGFKKNKGRFYEFGDS